MFQVKITKWVYKSAHNAKVVDNTTRNQSTTRVVCYGGADEGVVFLTTCEKKVQYEIQLPFKLVKELMRRVVFEEVTKQLGASVEPSAESVQ